MSEAVAELPEAPPAPQKDADEIIAQLAGKEVDRLLASAEIEREDELGPRAQVEGARAISSPAGPLAADAAKSACDDEAVLAQQIEALIAGDKDKATHTETAPTAATVEDVAITTQPLAPAEPGASAEVSAAESAQASAVQDAAPKSGDAAPTSEPQSESSNVDPLEIPSDDSHRLPILLLPLDWLNRPFAFISEGARNALGKIAVLTSLNAAALIAYVIWFRHR